MATRRMFAQTIIDSDSFLDMPLSTQSLYFHMSMRADDDGFINNPKKIQKMIGASDDDMKLLMVKNFIIAFDTGVVVIKHWRIHNYIQKDRYKETVYKDEKSTLRVKENGAYTIDIPDGYKMDTECIQDGYKMDTQVRVGKDSTGKDIKREKGKPTLEEIQAYVLEKNMHVDPKQFFDYYEAGDWKDKDGKPVKSWKQKMITWNAHEIAKPNKKANGFHNFEERHDDLDASVMDDFEKMMNRPEV